MNGPAPRRPCFPGSAHVTWAGRAEGLDQLWPGAAMPPVRHDCEEVMPCPAGRGERFLHGTGHRVAAEQTVVLPRGRDPPLPNTEAPPLEILGVLNASPASGHLPDGSPLGLPRRSVAVEPNPRSRGGEWPPLPAQ